MIDTFRHRVKMILSLDRDNVTGQYSYGTGMRSLMDFIDVLRVRAKVVNDKVKRLKTVCTLRVNKFAKDYPRLAHMALFTGAVFALTFVSAAASAFSFRILRFLM
jgi:hypothetical protein